MANGKRVFRSRPKSLKGTPYDSLLEKRLHENALVGCEHHTAAIPYTIEHKYHPDFIVNQDDKVYLIEAKGYFQERAEASKYKWVAKALPDNCEIVFIFEKENKPLHFANVRNDGTRMTHEEWCIKNGFRCYTEDSFKIDVL